MSRRFSSKIPISRLLSSELVVKFSLHKNIFPSSRSMIPFIISCTNNYFLPIVIKFLKQIDNIWICHGLYIYQNFIICLIDKFLNLMARINRRHNDLWWNFRKLGESFVCEINLKNFFQKFSR